MNEFKAGFFMNPTDLHRHRLATTEKQLTEFWFSKTLIQLERILSIKDQYLIYQIVFSQFLNYYLKYKKISPGEVFHVMYQEQTFMYVYDAKIFRNQAYEKYDNDLISTFLIAYREKDELPNDDVFEFLDCSIVQKGEWILKVKQSAILRIFPYIIHRFMQKKESSFDINAKNSIGGYYLSKEPNLFREVVILDPKVYYYYMYSLTPRCQMNPQSSVRTVFQIISQLMYNNFLIAWYESLSQQQKYERHFKRYFRLIPKPKIKEEFTSIDDRFTQIKWQSFNIFVFKLKYFIKETEINYECYQIQQKNQEQLNQPYEDLSLDDQHLLKAFSKQRVSSPNYDQEYTIFCQYPQY